MSLPPHDDPDQNPIPDTDNKKKKPAERPRAQPAKIGEYLLRTRVLPDLYSDDPEKRAAAMNELIAHPDQAVPVLIQALNHDDRTTWTRTILVLKQIGDERALAILRQRSDDPDPLLQTLTGGAIRAIERRLAHPHPPPAPTRQSVAPTKQQITYDRREVPPAPPRFRVLNNAAPPSTPPAELTHFNEALVKIVRNRLMLLSVPDGIARVDATNELNAMSNDIVPIVRYFAHHSPNATLSSNAAGYLKTRQRYMYALEERRQQQKRNQHRRKNSYYAQRPDLF